MSKRTFKPEKRYKFSENVTEAALKKAFETGEVVTGRIRDFDTTSNCLFVKLSKTIEGVLPFSECFLENVDREHDFIPAPVEQLLRKKTVRVRIMEWTDKQITLSRKNSLLEVLDKAKHIEGRKVCAMVDNVTTSAVHCDIGDGLIAYCPLGQISNTFINDATTWYKRGDIVRVLITKVDVDAFKIDCSIKQANPRDYSQIYPGSSCNVKVGNPIYREGVLTGFFVEVSPSIVGIADVNTNFAEKHAKLCPGDIVRCQVKQVFPDENKVKLFIKE